LNLAKVTSVKSLVKIRCYKLCSGVAAYELETDSKIRRPSGTVAKEQGPPKLVTDYGAQRACFFIWVIKLRIRWAGLIACKGERRGVYRVLVGKPEGKRPPGRPRRR